MIMGANEFKNSDVQSTAFGEIDTDPGKSADEAVEFDNTVSGTIDDGRGELSDTLVNIPLVISKFPVEDVGDDYSSPIGVMSENDKSVLKDRITKALRKAQVRGLREVVDVVAKCMPDGVRKPELCDRKSSRVVQVVEDEVQNPEMVIEFSIMGMPNKISIEKNRVRIYVSFGPKYVLYAE
jgi:hypothetical protein